MKYNLISSSKTRIDKSLVSGRGIFANESIKKGELIEQCHFIIPTKEFGAKDAELMRYMFALVKEENAEEIEKVNADIYLANLLACRESFKSKAEELCELGYKKLNELTDKAVVLGIGMIFNHSEKPNVIYNFNEADFCFDYFASENLNTDDELFINYGNSSREDLL